MNITYQTMLVSQANWLATQFASHSVITDDNWDGFVDTWLHAGLEALR